MKAPIRILAALAALGLSVSAGAATVAAQTPPPPASVSYNSAGSISVVSAHAAPAFVGAGVVDARELALRATVSVHFDRLDP